MCRLVVFRLGVLCTFRVMMRVLSVNVVTGTRFSMMDVVLHVVI